MSDWLSADQPTDLKVNILPLTPPPPPGVISCVLTQGVRNALQVWCLLAGLPAGGQSVLTSRGPQSLNDRPALYRFIVFLVSAWIAVGRGGKTA